MHSMIRKDASVPLGPASHTDFPRPGGAPSPPHSPPTASSEGTAEGTVEASQLNPLACRRDAAPDVALSDTGPRHPYPDGCPVARESELSGHAHGGLPAASPSPRVGPLKRRTRVVTAVKTAVIFTIEIPIKTSRNQKNRYSPAPSLPEGWKRS